MEFLFRNFGTIDDNIIKRKIINSKFAEKDFDFLYSNYKYISSGEQKQKILKKAFEDENVEFLNEYFSDMPREMKYEAAIKFKGLKISEEEMQELLRM